MSESLLDKQHGPLLYEGKAKRVFLTNDPDKVLVHFKNDATAFNALKHAQIEGKGSLNCQISSFVFNWSLSKLSSTKSKFSFFSL